MPARHEAQGDLDQLDLDARAQPDGVGLGALGELPADRVVLGRFGVVEDQRRGDELLDRRGPPGALGHGGDVEHLVAHDRPDVEPLVVDREHDDGGLELAAADAVGGHRRVAADEPHGHVRVALEERRDERLEAPDASGGAEGAQRHRAALQRRELAHARRRVVERLQAAGRVHGEGLTGLGRQDAAGGAHEQVGARGSARACGSARRRPAGRPAGPRRPR